MRHSVGIKWGTWVIHEASRASRSGRFNGSDLGLRADPAGACVVGEAMGRLWGGMMSRVMHRSRGLGAALTVDTWSILDSRVNMRIDTDVLWQSLGFSVYRDAEELREAWLELAQFANDPYSCFAWCQSWYKAAKEHNTGTPLIVVGRSPGGRIEMLLPLFLERKAGMQLVTRPARRISGDFGGIFRPELRASVNEQNASAFWSKVCKAIPGDVLVLNGVSSDEIERKNPLGFLYRHQSRIDGFHTALSGDWEKQYEEMFSSKIRRNDRRCGRRMSEEGEVVYEVVAGVQAQGAALKALLDQKIEQLEQAGQPHHYRDATVSAFYKNLPELMQESPDEEFLFVALKYDGRVIATNFGVRKGERHYGMMTSMNDDMRKFSPGRLVMLETAKFLTERGCSFYDFGNGEYQYKQYWCTGKRSRYTVLAPLSWKGRIVVLGIKIAIRRNNKKEEREAQKSAKKGQALKPSKKEGL